jgi:cellulose synthase/poly-beta-1,6-N-acetylglucosamine synthase-like glycosyltransferase
LTVFADIAVWVLVVAAAGASSYLLLLTFSAFLPRRHLRDAPSRDRARLAVVIPAHDEELMLPDLLETLRAQTYDKAHFTVHVLADNCGDATAALARRNGAVTHERNDPEHSGKGQAIAWLLPELIASDADAFVFIDADSYVEPRFLETIDGYLGRGDELLQASYRVARPDSSWLVSLRALAFGLMHELRGRGKSRLGISTGIWGNGMVFSRDALANLGWQSFSSVEDAEHHLRMLLAGRRVRFVPEVSVYGDMPGSLKAARSQQVRWEAGRLALVRRYGPRLLRRATLRRDISAASALIELVLPPLSVLLGFEVAVAALALLLAPGTAAVVAQFSLLGLAAYILGGFPLSGLRPRSYIALVYAPAYVLWKTVLYSRELVRRTDSAWIRTSRKPPFTPGQHRAPHGVSAIKRLDDRK